MEVNPIADHVSLGNNRSFTPDCHPTQSNDYTYQEPIHLLSRLPKLRELEDEARND
jgi:hypothetical protein